jgi:holo-[acyl-carrier protein] synthase
MNNIFGIGTDIVDIARIRKLLVKNRKFKNRIFSTQEIKYCESKVNKISSYSKRFAAKEAFAKALGVGIRKGVSFNEISIINNKNGIYLSLSDEKKYALATVIISF